MKEKLTNIVIKLQRIGWTKLIIYISISIFYIYLIGIIILKFFTDYDHFQGSVNNLLLVTMILLMIWGVWGVIVLKRRFLRQQNFKIFFRYYYLYFDLVKWYKRQRLVLRELIRVLELYQLHTVDLYFTYHKYALKRVKYLDNLVKHICVIHLRKILLESLRLNLFYMRIVNKLIWSSYKFKQKYLV